MLPHEVANPVYRPEVRRPALLQIGNKHGIANGALAEGRRLHVRLLEECCDFSRKLLLKVHADRDIPTDRHPSSGFCLLELSDNSY